MTFRSRIRVSLSLRRVRYLIKVLFAQSLTHVTTPFDMSFDNLVWSATTKAKPVILSAQSIHQQAIETFPDTSHGHVTWRTLVSTSRTPSKELTVGIAVCPAGSGSLHHHRHAQAEIYHIISGFVPSR